VFEKISRRGIRGDGPIDCDIKLLPVAGNYNGRQGVSAIFDAFDYRIYQYRFSGFSFGETRFL